MNNLFLLITFLACVGSVQSGAISVADVTPASLVAGASGVAVATFTTATDIPADGKFVVIFPTGFDLSGTTVTAITGQTGAAGTDHTIACVSLTCTVTRGTSGTPAIFTPGETTVTFGVVKNPTVSGNTGTFTITTQNNGGTEIDTLATVPLVAITAGVIGTASVVPADDVAGATGTATVTFTTANPVPADGTIVITFPANYDLTGTPVAAKTSGGFDGTLTVSVASQVLTITRSSGAIAVAGVQVLTLTNIKNPAFAGATGAFTITTTTAAPANIDTLATVAARTITAGVITTASVVPADDVAGATGTAVVTFTTANPVPVDGKIVITFPANYDLTGTPVAAKTSGGFDGTLTVSVASQVLTITRSGGAIAVAGAQVLSLTNIKNPATSGATGTFTITTTTTTPVNIDTLATVAARTINFAITAAQTIYKGATVATSGAQTANWLCWKAGTAATTVACGAKSDKTDFGADGCSDDNPATRTLTWTTVAGTHVAIKECSAVDTAVGVEVDVVFTDKNFVVTAGAAPTIAKGATVATTGAQAANWYCWTAGTEAGAATCAVAGTATDFGVTGCSAANPSTLTLTWTTLAGTHVAIKECSAANTAAGQEVDVVFTEANIAITGGATQAIVAGAALAVTELGSGRHLCWTAAATATAITACTAAGTANDAGTSGCGAVDDASLVWTTVAGTHVSIIQCNAAVVVGSAVATVLTQQIVVASQNITAGSIVTVAGLTTGNHLCWTAGTVAGSATCAAAGTAVDLGVTGCGAADDNTIAWTTTSKDYIAIKECSGTTTVGAEVDLVLGVVTTTAAPAAATTTVSGASSEAAWSTMLTVFAIAMAAFSTL